MNTKAKKSPDSSAEHMEPPKQGWQAKRLEDGYSIPTIKTAYNVILDHKMTGDELLAIGRSLVDKTVERTFISFHLKGRELGTCWASTHADPKIELRILGVPKGHTWGTSELTGARKGSWVNEGLKYLASIVETPDGPVIEQIDMDGVASIERLTLTDGRYHVDDEPEVYYVISGANLEAWTSEGPRRFDVHYPPMPTD